MEIPYVVESRKDTGLNNSKIGIWLFLASEVMLFGGLFSGYVFLRIYADYPWPERTLPVLPGLINTFVLIGSSVTVVFAWVSLKLRQWRKFQIYMAITILCAALFMVLKAVEYSAKFHHQAISLSDYTIVEGHAHPQGGKEYGAPTKNFNINADSVQINLRRVDDIYYEELSEQYTEGGLVLANEVALNDGNVLAKGTAISKEIIDQAKKDYLAAVAHNSEIDIEVGRQAWAEIKARFPGKKYYELVESGKTLNQLANAQIKKLEAQRKDDYRSVTASLTFVPSSGSALISVNPYWGKLSNPREGEKGTLQLKDETLVSGTTADSSIALAVDGIDFRHTVMKAEEKGIDPAAAVANSWLLKDEQMKLIWDKHQLLTAKLAEKLKAKDREPTENDIYRINWQEIAGLMDKDIATLEGMEYDDILALYPGDIEGFAGPKHKKHGDPDSSGVVYPEIVVPREKVRFESLFSPRWNTYYATYFTITGLHGLHVVAGALVLAYYLFFGRKMYEEKPEWLANRVEVGGLFWHFVDLVWIFLFPILYLM